MGYNPQFGNSLMDPHLCFPASPRASGPQEGGVVSEDRTRPARESTSGPLQGDPRPNRVCTRRPSTPSSSIPAGTTNGMVSRPTSSTTRGWQAAPAPPQAAHALLRLEEGPCLWDEEGGLLEASSIPWLVASSNFKAYSSRLSPSHITSPPLTLTFPLPL
ncbi:uncharacterized protein LOC106999543 [Macaca mulatta]